MSIRPLNDWVLVKLQPLDHWVGSIFVPAGSDHRKARVIKTGPGKELPSGVREPTGVQEGDLVVFNRAHGEHRLGKTLMAQLGDDQLLIKPQDILVVLNQDVHVS